VLWSGHRFRTNAKDLQELWSRLPAEAAGAVTVVVKRGHGSGEAQAERVVPLTAWCRRRGADVVLVPPERSADLRAHRATHTKCDPLDSVLLAQAAAVAPEGLRLEHGLGPGEPLRRATKLHSTLVTRRRTSLAGLDALLEILGPDWHCAFGAPLGTPTPPCGSWPSMGRGPGLPRAGRGYGRRGPPRPGPGPGPDPGDSRT